MLASPSKLLISIFLVVFSLSHAYDPDPLQDFCVGVDDSKSAVFVNGKVCKNPKFLTVDDFIFSGLNEVRNVTSSIGTKLTPVFVRDFPSLNTMGVSMARIDFAPKGLNAPHEHPRASEILLVMEGTLYAGFITSNALIPNVPNKLFAKTLHAGDIIVFPKGLIHFQYNVGDTNAVAFAIFGSQNPGVVTIANAMFGSDPPVDPEVLAKAFQLGEDQVENLQSLTWMGNV